MDISDLVDYAHDDCVFDIYDVINDKLYLKGGSKEKALKFHSKKNYELQSFEPIQRKDDNDDVIFGIVFNVEMR